MALPGQAGGEGGALPPTASSLLLPGQTQVSGDFGSGAEGGHQPSGRDRVSWCPRVLRSAARFWG